MNQILAVVIAYLVGSVSFGVLVARAQGFDIYTVGSGNPGMSNVMRTLGKRSAALVLVGDAAKGVIAAAVGVSLVDPLFGYVALLAAVVGHAFPVWHRFRGGKGVATTLGGLVFIAPLTGIALAVVWVVFLVVWKTASIGSLTAMVLMVPFLAMTGRRGVELAWAGAIAVFVVARHTSNIRRLLTTSERKVL
ncbi:MAG: glycerol-3-phosphate 1-O-acyltransferase PlsY [Acidimicrobiia bacterium]|nr:MAG: glycerol-3-phosphate 1-O-acyltransferase PlsY [Acidimicrobiia bacterium]